MGRLDSTSRNKEISPELNESGQMIRAVIFDVGGVLVHQKNHEARRVWEKRLGLPPGDLQRIVFESKAAEEAATGLTSESELWEEVGGTLHLNDKEISELQYDFRAGEELGTELVQFIKSLRPRYKIGVLSNAWSDARLSHNTKFQMNTWIDVAVYSAEVSLIKPDPEIYQLVVSQLGECPERCIFVDDSAMNVEAAQKLGMKGIVCRDIRQTIDEIKQYLALG